jgi:hypothetical protein
MNKTRLGEEQMVKILREADEASQGHRGLSRFIRTPMSAKVDSQALCEERR